MKNKNKKPYVVPYERMLKIYNMLRFLISERIRLNKRIKELEHENKRV